MRGIIVATNQPKDTEFDTALNATNLTVGKEPFSSHLSVVRNAVKNSIFDALSRYGKFLFLAQVQMKHLLGGLWRYNRVGENENVPIPQQPLLSAWAGEIGIGACIGVRLGVYNFLNWALDSIQSLFE